MFGWYCGGFVYLFVLLGWNLLVLWNVLINWLLIMFIVILINIINKLLSGWVVNSKKVVFFMVVVKIVIIELKLVCFLVNWVIIIMVFL